MRRRTIRRLFAPVVVLSVSAAACSGEEPIALRKANPEAHRGGTITVAIDEPRSIDPPAANPLDPAGSTIVETVCDRLIELDPITGDPKPAIAESWIISDGGERVTFKLRKGVKFHNGRELVAEDVVYSLSRIAERDFAGPSAAIMEPVDGYEQVHGNKEVEEERFRKTLQGIEIIENYSFEIQLSSRRADFFRALAHVAASPVPKREVEADPEAFARRPICTGPYRMAGPWKPGDDTIKLERFPEYYKGNTAFTGGGAGYADAIEFKIYRDRAAQVAAFTKGTVDVAHVPEASSFAAKGGDAIVAARVPVLEYIGLPTHQDPFDKRGVRIAFSQALDRSKLVNEVYKGMREPATEFLSPSLGDFYRKQACEGNTPLTANLAAARQSLRAAGIDLTGKTLKFYFNDEFGHRRLVDALTKQWSAAFGVRFELIGSAWEPYAVKASGQPGFDGLFRMSWSPAYLSPDQYLEPLFSSGSIGKDNFSRYSSREFDRGLDKNARRAADERDLHDEYQILEDVACGDMPIIPLDYGTRLYAIDGKAIGNAIDARASAATGMILLRELFVR